MTPAKITQCVFVALILLVGIYDIAALAAWGPSATISQAVGIEGSFASPLIPFCLGFVAGHLVWPQKRKK